MGYEMITLATHDAVATITLNRPERLNACPTAMADELLDALGQLQAARALLITGAGRAFCSGADLAARGDGAPGDASHRALTEHYNPLIMALTHLPLPVVAAVNGPAAGIGASIALAADFVVAAQSAYFLQAFVNIGLVPDGGASWMLTRLIGKARATEMMMLGEKIPAAKAHDWGMVYKVVEHDSLIDEAMTLAKRLASMPTVALGIMRKNLVEALECDFATALTREAEGQKIAGDTNDAREGAMAFLQKRKPNFNGS